MSSLHFRGAFNRLSKGLLFKSLKTGAAAFVIAASLVMPAAADHNDNDDLTPRTSNTEHSNDLRGIQEEFNKAVNDRRLILVDRDWLEINNAANDLQNNEELRNKYLSEFVMQNGNIHLSKDYFQGLTSSDMNSPHTQIVTLGNDNGDSMRGCLIFAGVGNLDGKESVRDFIDISRAIHGDAFKDANIKTFPDAEDFKEFVTYHEIGHCMDDWYIATMNNAQTLGEYLDLYHRAETFSDVFSALMMAREQGVTDMAETIANIRLADMALSGPFQAEWSSQNSIGHYASYIYATHRPVRAAQDFIDQVGVAQLQNMSYHEIALKAKELVDKHALSSKDADALIYLFENKHDMNLWDRLKDQVSFIDERHQNAVTLRNEMDEALRKIFDLSHIPANQNAVDHITFAGTPADYVREANARVDQDEVSKRAKDLGNSLVSQAGPGADLDKLLAVFTQNKDKWRDALSNGSDVERAEAMENLAVSTRALWRASQQIQGLNPDAANDNTVVTPVPQAPSINMK